MLSRRPAPLPGRSSQGHSDADPQGRATERSPERLLEQSPHPRSGLQRFPFRAPPQPGNGCCKRSFGNGAGGDPGWHHQAGWLGIPKGPGTLLLAWLVPPSTTPPAPPMATSRMAEDPLLALAAQRSRLCPTPQAGGTPLSTAPEPTWMTQSQDSAPNVLRTAAPWSFSTQTHLRVQQLQRGSSAEASRSAGLQRSKPLKCRFRPPHILRADCENAKNLLFLLMWL